PLVGGSAVLRGLGTLVEAVVADDGGDAQAVVAEQAGASGRLGAAVLGDVAPGLDRLLVAEEGQRQDLFRMGATLEPLEGDEAVYVREQRPQGGGHGEIVLTPSGRGLDLEDDGDHGVTGGVTNGACGAEASFKNVRSSRMMRRSRLASSKFSLASGSAAS